jgi:hypothetical protein
MKLNLMLMFAETDEICKYAPKVPISRLIGCAVERRWSSAEEKSRPGTGSFHPVAIEAAAEATKLLKPSV